MEVYIVIDLSADYDGTYYNGIVDIFDNIENAEECAIAKELEYLEQGLNHSCKIEVFKMKGVKNGT